jgi:hypothetical protein
VVIDQSPTNNETLNQTELMEIQASTTRKLLTRIHWQSSDEFWLIALIKITQSGDTIEDIQIHGLEPPSDTYEVSPYDIEDMELADLPLALALRRPSHRDNVWIVGDGDNGETEGLLDALVAGGIIAAPHCFFGGDQAICKLLV